jgi:hypothetical protein
MKDLNKFFFIINPVELKMVLTGFHHYLDGLKKMPNDYIESNPN